MKSIVSLCTLILFSCAFRQVSQKKGFVRYTTLFYDSLTKQYDKELLFSDFNVWYKDKLFIEEIKTVENYRDTGGAITRKTPTAYYLFMDRESNSFYHYSSFSDSAHILDKYMLPDTALMRGLGGWAFYTSGNIKSVGKLQLLTDTIIDKVTYKRVTLPIITNGYMIPIIAYQRCDEKGSAFQFYRDWGNELGCPVTRIDFLPSPDDPYPSSSEIHFIRDTLTKEEERVFDAWEKNLKKFPVNN